MQLMPCHPVLIRRVLAPKGEFNRRARYQWDPGSTHGLADPRLFWSYKKQVIGGVLPLALNVGVFVFEVFRVVPWRCSPGPSYSPPTASSAFVGMTALAYAFGGHGMYPEQIREMASPREWPRVMRMTWVVLVPLYWGCGILGYAAYGDYAQANLNLNFPDGEQNKRTY